MHDRGLKTEGSRLTLALSLVAALFVAAYANSWRNAFHFDDTHVIVSNRAISSLANAPRFFTDARTFSSLPANQTYRPFVALSLAVDQALARALTGDPLDPQVYHFTQLLWLAVVSVLLGLVAAAAFRTTVAPEADDRWPEGAAIVVAGLFALHLGNSEVGNYISARSETLSAAGVLGALLLWARGGVWRRRHLYLVAMLFGAMAKTPAVLFAPLLLCWCILHEAQLSPEVLRTPEGRAALRRIVVGTLPAFAAAVVAYWFIEGMNPPRQSYGGGALLPYLWTQVWVWVRYAGMFFVPVGLSADSDWQLLSKPFDPRVLAGLVLLAGSICAAWQAARRRDTRPIAFGLAWFWLGLVPSTVVPLAEVTNDHRPFFSFMGLAVAAVWAGALAMRRVWPTRGAAKVAIGFGTVVLVAHAAATRARNRVWATDATLWADVVRASPANGRGLMNYGLTAMRAGRYAEARVMFDSAAKLSPGYPLIYVNRAIAADAQSDSIDAAADFAHALALSPDDADAHRYYARFLAAHGHGPQALTHYAAAALARPADLDARHEGLLLMAAGGPIDAVRTEAGAILRLDPADSIAGALAGGRATVQPANGAAVNGLSAARRWYLSGWALTSVGRHAEAIQAYREAVTADPSNVDAWNNLGWSLGRLGFFHDARVALERARQLAPANALVNSNLAWVEGENVRLDRLTALAGAPR
jgi:Flp pilus assembly protein TadD